MRDLKQVKTDFVTIARATQAELIRQLPEKLRAAGYDVIRGDGYIYARGQHVLLTAHMDTVHALPVKRVQTIAETDDIIVSSPQGIGGDDRCGIWVILDVLPRLIADGIRPAVLFCEDEEIGGVGSGKFCRTEYIDELAQLKYLIELDRKGNNDAVYYDDANTKFHKYIRQVTGYKEAHGSFSDISHLCPACGVSGVNLSVGYYNAHHTDEYVRVAEMAHTADVVVDLIKDTVAGDIGAFSYVDAWEAGGYYTGAFLNDYYECADRFVEFQFVEDCVVQYDTACGSTLDECIGKLMLNHPGLSWSDVLDYEIF